MNCALKKAIGLALCSFALGVAFTIMLPEYLLAILLALVLLAASWCIFW